MILQTDYKFFDTAPMIDINRPLTALINKLDATVCEFFFGLIYGGLLLCYSGLNWVWIGLFGFCVVVVVMMMLVVVVVVGGW